MSKESKEYNDKKIEELKKKEMRKNKESEKRKVERLTQKEMQRQFNMFKKRFKMRSKSELVAIIWEQGMEFRRLQDIAQELYEENKVLKPEQEESEKEVQND